MDANDYQILVERTMKLQSPNEALSNYSMGLAGESGELIDLLKKHVYHDHPLNIDKVRNELGDIIWYVSAISSQLGIELNAVMNLNIAKLRARFPNGFSSADSIARADVK